MQASPVPPAVRQFAQQSILSVSMFTACILAAGCGGNHAPDSKDEPGHPFEILLSEKKVPADYVLADPECQEANTPVTLTETVVHLWNGNDVTATVQPLSGLNSTRSLVGTAVNSVVFNDTHERYCDGRRGALACYDHLGREKDWSSTNTGRPLRICKDNYTYPRSSYEAVGLASLAHIESANTRLRQLAPERAKKLPAISLNVLPAFIDYTDYVAYKGRYWRLKEYFVDNMVYFPGRHMIAALPVSRSRASEKGFYWDSPFVLAHEYSHHIELAAGPATAGLAWNPLHHSFDDIVALAQGLSPNTQRALISGSLSEAFADLFAYYTLRGDVSSLVGIPCMGRNRDLTQDHFVNRNRDTKVLTEDRLSQLLSDVKSEHDLECGEVYYEDIHIIGAILAYQIDRALTHLARAALPAQTRSALSSSAPEEEIVAADFDARFKLALAWLERLHVHQSELSDSQTGSMLLKPLLQAFADVTTTTLPSLGLTESQREDVRNAVCKDLREGLPAITQTPDDSNQEWCF